MIINNSLLKYNNTSKGLVFNKTLVGRNEIEELTKKSSQIDFLTNSKNSTMLNFELYGTGLHFSSDTPLYVEGNDTPIFYIIVYDNKNDALLDFIPFSLDTMDYVSTLNI